MVIARQLDDVGCAILQCRAGNLVVVVLAVNALHKLGVDGFQIIDRVAGSTLRLLAEPAHDRNHIVHLVGEREQRHLGDRRFVRGFEPIVGGGHDIGTERVTDQKNVLHLPLLAIEFDNLRQIVGRLLRLAL